MKHFVMILAASLLGISNAQAKDLKDPELIYALLAETFPGIVEHAGGLSTSIDLKELNCSFSNVRTGDLPSVKTSCFGVGLDNRNVSATGGTANLIFGLINSGLELDQAVEPGTTYIRAKDLSCMRLECKSSSPSECESIPVSYECSAE